jgi:superfamily I DNA/RNA helicase
VLQGGAGKTLILAFRAEYLARASSNPVLILCYANGIAGRLEDVMQERGIEDRVQVRTFHSWCHQMLKTYGIPGPSQEQYPDYNERLAALVRTVEAEILLGHIPGGQYDAVLIDEAHDFEPEWLSLAVKMVNPNTKAFMIAYDDMQAIYKGRRRPVWSQLGNEAWGARACYLYGTPCRYRGSRGGSRKKWSARGCGGGR